MYIDGVWDNVEIFRGASRYIVKGSSLASKIYSFFEEIEEAIKEAKKHISDHGCYRSYVIDTMTNKYLSFEPDELKI